MSILALILGGFIIGALARWAVPGPDPMPFFMTVLIGLVGAAIGSGVGALAVGIHKHPSADEYFVVWVTAIVSAALIVVLYRRVVQKRPITGPQAQEFPTRGLGLNRLRTRMPARMTKQQVLDHLDELHDKGQLTDEEYLDKRRAVLRQG